MAGTLVIFSALCVIVSMVDAEFFGIGVWESLAINKCEKDSHIFKFDITLVNKVNDTHDLYKGHFVLGEDFTQDYGLRLEICKIEDGNCAQSQTMKDESLIEFLETYAKESVDECMKSIHNLDSPTMPIPKGEYDMEHYVYSHEPGVSMFGEYNITVIVLDGDEEVGCMEFHMEFKNIE